MAIIQDAGAREAALQTLIDFAQQFRADISYRTAVCGDGAGNVFVNANRIYARLGASDGDVVEARVSFWTPNDGDAILLKRETAGGLGGWLVMGWLNGDAQPCVPLG